MISAAMNHVHRISPFMNIVHRFLNIVHGYNMTAAFGEESDG
jgi:hypothetical protein